MKSSIQFKKFDPFPKIENIENAEDTYDLIDRLLSLGSDPVYIFFDIDETLLMRDTCLVHGYRKTSQLLDRLKENLIESNNKRTDHIIDNLKYEMEKMYYCSDLQLVDPLLARLIRGLKLKGHFVFGLTSNSATSEHSINVMETLSKYKLRFSVPEVRGELPNSGALVMQHVTVNGIIFADNNQIQLRDKGEIMVEFVELCLKSKLKAKEEEKKEQMCILVDNTEKKCLKAMTSFMNLKRKFLLDMKVIQYTQAEAAIDAGLFTSQFHKIIDRMLVNGVIDDKMADELGNRKILDDVMLHPLK
eukprot:CAMPEP_0171462110 /NCGR_PEP_ID=MMETSP0945-20130129/6284_1 /TAXON_ID=109269 /ORGANISM="Vaucheria litorea, Strain CCMP2940" /LENGTH=302 /DNA_ID=CAMNT_0011988581 /DNA_START=116 /DNA_END=1024 /DNA_ORIENTATION=-